MATLTITTLKHFRLDQWHKVHQALMFKIVAYMLSKIDAKKRNRPLHL